MIKNIELHGIGKRYYQVKLKQDIDKPFLRKLFYEIKVNKNKTIKQ